jgi:hypothetical protein
MDGHHFKDSGGPVDGIDIPIGVLNLPPGKYLIMAKVWVAAYAPSPSTPPMDVAYHLVLDYGGDSDEIYGAVNNDFSQPGSRYESVSLSIAGESTTGQPAILTVGTGSYPGILALTPRITAIPVDNLDIQQGGSGGGGGGGYYGFYEEQVNARRGRG